MNIKIKLKELNQKDITKEYCNWLNDYEVSKYTEQKYFVHNLNTVKKFVKEKKNSKLEFLYGIFLNYDHDYKHVGNIKIGPINNFHKNAEISYFIGNKKFWGKGITSLAIKKVLKICKKKFGIKKVIAGCYANNLGSIKVLKKNKFVQEAKLKNHIIFEGKRIDQYIFGKKI